MIFASGNAATIKPIHALVARVMDGIGSPALLIDGTASPHTYNLRPSDAAALEGADLVVWVGPTFEAFLDGTVQTLTHSGETLALIDTPGLTLHYARDDAGAHGEEDSHREEHAHGDEHTHRDEHAHFAGADPHIWLDPHNALQMVGAIAQTLGLEQPSRMFDFARNAAAVAARIKDLQAATEATVGPIRNRPFLVFHDAFQYFENAFNIRAIGAVSLGESRSPGARRIKTLRREIAARKVVCVFAEPQFEPQIIATLIEGTAVRRGVLDPIGARIRAGPDAYFQMMQSNANALVSCLR